jgi:hypothetical protein
MNRLRWWLVSGAGIPWALSIGAIVSSTHPTGQRACRRPANFIGAGQREMNLRVALAWLWAAEVAHKDQLRMEMAMRLERFPKRKSV